MRLTSQLRSALALKAQLISVAGARPSSGAATYAWLGGSENCSAAQHSSIAAPEDGRAPAARCGAMAVSGYALMLIAATVLVGSVCAQTNPAPSPRYEIREDHDRDGIGKFYMGREIAHVMGHQAADWLERPEREDEERPSLALPALKLKPGDAVADIGAGSGYYTRRLAKLVGDKGVIYAVDIQQEMLDLLTNKMAELKIHNVKPVLGDVKDPKLPRASVDLALLVDVYHEFDYPCEMVQAICTSLKPGGRIAFVEFRGEDPKVPIKLLHKMTEAQVRKEMSVHPLDWVETSEVLPWQHIIIFKKTDRSR